jgi:hypothetical protein
MPVRIPSPRTGHFGLSSDMRAIVATAMLFLQLQPVLGVALCSAMGGSDGDRMEAGCPMPESAAGSANYHKEAWSAPDPSRACVFAEACAPSPTVANSAAPGIVSVPLQIDPVIRLPDLLLPTEGRSPPVPPPKA